MTQAGRPSGSQKGVGEVEKYKKDRENGEDKVEDKKEKKRGKKEVNLVPEKNGEDKVVEEENPTGGLAGDPNNYEGNVVMHSDHEEDLDEDKKEKKRGEDSEESATNSDISESEEPPKKKRKKKVEEEEDKGVTSDEDEEEEDEDEVESGSQEKVITPERDIDEIVVILLNGELSGARKPRIRFFFSDKQRVKEVVDILTIPTEELTSIFKNDKTKKLFLSDVAPTKSPRGVTNLHCVKATSTMKKCRHTIKTGSIGFLYTTRWSRPAAVVVLSDYKSGESAGKSCVVAKYQNQFTQLQVRTTTLHCSKCIYHKWFKDPLIRIV